MRTMNRYHRQMMLPFIGEAGQRRLSSARVVLVGCGALGCVAAEQLVRGGVGSLRIIDRDIVEWTNMQRQTLFDEGDAREGTPKAVAAAGRLGRINSEVAIEPIVADVHAGNIQELAAGELILDGTDNAETRYLINDWSVKQGIAWIYGACVGTEGRAMFIEPGRTPCLRCIFPDPPAAGELPTCDTAGVLAAAAAIAASMQAGMAIQYLAGSHVAMQLTRFDLSEGRFHGVDVSGSRRDDCPACGRREFEFLGARSAELSGRLCGRDAVQLVGSGAVDFQTLESRIAATSAVHRTRYFMRWDVDGVRITLFPDGRAIIQGTTDIAQARSLYARYVGI